MALYLGSNKVTQGSKNGGGGSLQAWADNATITGQLQANTITEIGDLTFPIATDASKLLLGANFESVGDLYFPIATNLGAFAQNINTETIGTIYAPNVTNAASFITNCKIKKLGGLVGDNVTTVKSFAYGAGSLEEITNALDFSSVTNSTAAFTMCGSLRHIRFVENSIKISVAFSSSSRLDIDSLKSIILGLADYAGTDSEYAYALTLHDTSKVLLEAEGATAPDGGTWLDYIFTKGWNY